MAHMDSAYLVITHAKYASIHRPTSHVYSHVIITFSTSAFRFRLSTSATAPTSIQHQVSGIKSPLKLSQFTVKREVAEHHVLAGLSRSILKNLRFLVFFKKPKNLKS